MSTHDQHSANVIQVQWVEFANCLKASHTDSVFVNRNLSVHDTSFPSHVKTWILAFRDALCTRMNLGSEADLSVQTNNIGLEDMKAWFDDKRKEAITDYHVLREGAVSTKKALMPELNEQTMSFSLALDVACFLGFRYIAGTSHVMKLYGLKLYNKMHPDKQRRLPARDGDENSNDSEEMETVPEGTVSGVGERNHVQNNEFVVWRSNGTECTLLKLCTFLTWAEFYGTEPENKNWDQRAMLGDLLLKALELFAMHAPSWNLEGVRFNQQRCLAGIKSTAETTWISNEITSKSGSGSSDKPSGVWHEEVVKRGTSAAYRKAFLAHYTYKLRMNENEVPKRRLEQNGSSRSSAYRTDKRQRASQSTAAAPGAESENLAGSANASSVVTNTLSLGSMMKAQHDSVNERANQLVEEQRKRDADMENQLKQINANLTKQCDSMNNLAHSIMMALQGPTAPRHPWQQTQTTQPPQPPVFATPSYGSSALSIMGSGRSGSSSSSSNYTVREEE